MQRYIALDIGKKRTGIALVDDHARVATPLKIISHATTSPKYIEELVHLIDEWEPVALIAGLPIDLKGKEAIAATQVRTEVNALAERINSIRHASGRDYLEVNFVDERLTTAQAERTMRDADMSSDARKRLRDALAAAVIAQTFIDTL